MRPQYIYIYIFIQHFQMHFFYEKMWFLECKYSKWDIYTFQIIPPAQQSCWGGILVSLRPSVPRPSRIPCPLCSFYSSGWIHFIFMHLIKQLQKVCHVQSFLPNFKNFKFWQFFKICNFDFVLFWLGIWCESLVWVIMGRRGVSQNAGILVVLVYFWS